MKIAFIGAGNVGAPLAARLAEAGHEVVIGQAKEGSATVSAALARSSKLAARTVREAVAAAEVVVLAVPFRAAEEVVTDLADLLVGKVLIDATNPVGPGLSHGLGSQGSGSARLAAAAPRARVVKAFSIYGFENFENPAYPAYAVKPAMLFCGDDAAAKATVAPLVEACGFEPVDVGGLVQALHLEHMTLLWVRLVRAEGHTPNLVWAALRR